MPAAQARVATVATNDVLYHIPHGACCRMSSPASACIPRSIMPDFRKNAMPIAFSNRRTRCCGSFPNMKHAVRRTWEIAERCNFSLDQLTYTYPTEELEDGLNAQDRLEKLTWEGAGQALSGRPAG